MAVVSESYKSPHGHAETPISPKIHKRIYRRVNVQDLCSNVFKENVGRAVENVTNKVSEYW